MSEFNANPPQPRLPDPGQPERPSARRVQLPPKRSDYPLNPQQFTFTPPTSWQSIPSAIRFAVWVWAISVIVSVAGAAVFAILMVLGVAAGLGGLS